MTSVLHGQSLVSVQRLIAALSQPAYLKRLDGRYLEVNTAWARFFHKTPGEFVGHRDGELMPEALAQMLQANDNHFWKRGEVAEVEECIEVAEGDAHGVRTLRSPVVDNKGNFVAMLAVCRHVRADDGVDSGEESEHFHTASHMAAEMQLPLNSILGFASLVSEGSLTVDQAEWIESVNFAARSLLTTTSTMIEMSQIRRGELEAEHRLFSLRDIIRDGVQRFLGRMMDQRISISYRVEPNVPEVLLGDRSRIRKIIHQLLDNAVKFTEEGEIAIRAKQLREADGKVVLQLTLADTGPGIPQAQLGRVLEPFVRVDHGEHGRGHGEGAGLGLSIAKALCDSLGGELQLRNREEGGLEAIATFAADPGAAGHGFTDLKTTKTAPVTATGHRRLKILMAEDLPSAQKLSYFVFRKIGHDLTLVSNGEQLLEALRKEQYDAVFVDVQMPVMDGLEAAKRIRQGEAGETNRDIFLAAVTACVTEDVKLRCFTAGMNHFLDKPLLVEKIKQVIRRIQWDQSQRDSA